MNVQKCNVPGFTILNTINLTERNCFLFYSQDYGIADVGRLAFKKIKMEMHMRYGKPEDILLRQKVWKVGEMEKMICSSTR